MTAASIDDVRVDSMLLELRDLLAADGLQATGSLARLLDYDRKHHAEMLATLRAWLDAFGDVNRAAATVHVHPNTFRYRMRRLTEISGIDLDDPDARFGAMLQLRLLEPRRSVVAEAVAADEGP
jgi:DNA-binding PucR family transcriptional regulator